MRFRSGLLALPFLALVVLTSPAVALRADVPTAAPTLRGAVGTMQTQLVNPTTADFDASSDHAVILNTVALVTKYWIDVYKPDATLGTSIDLGKPTPVAGKITFTGLVTAMSTLPPAAGYFAKVAAEGPGGRSASAASALFTVAVRAPVPPASPAIR